MPKRNKNNWLFGDMVSKSRAHMDQQNDVNKKASCYLHFIGSSRNIVGIAIVNTEQFPVEVPLAHVWLNFQATAAFGNAAS